MTVVMTFGELVTAAAQGVFVATIAPPQLRGRYEATASLRETGRAVFPAAAGFVMAGYGASTLFTLTAALMLASGVIGLRADALAGARTRGG